MKRLSILDMTQLQIINHVLEQVAGNKGTPVEGNIWYDSTGKRIKFRTNVANLAVVTDGGDLTTNSVAVTAINGFDTQVRTNRLDQMAAPTAAVALNSQKITGLAAPTASGDAATKGYVDTAVTGLAWNAPVRAAATTNVTRATAVENGDIIGGVTLATGDRVLLAGQTAGAENGVYTVNASGAPTRATDADSSAELQGAALMVTEGTSAGTQWIQTVDGAITIDTTTITWVQFGGGATYTAGNGLTVSSNDFNVGQGTGIVVGADTVGIDTAVVVRKFAVDVGDNSATSITVTHNLGTRDVTVEVYQNSSTWDKVEADVLHATTNTITLVFAVAPTTAQFRCVVHG